MDMWLCKMVLLVGGGMLLVCPAGEAVLTESQEQALLDRHNYFRGLEGASNMRYMSWSQTLANKAQDWASGCRFIHDGTSSYGENLWVTSSQTFSDVIEVVNDWAGEKSGYNYETSICNAEPCGHYTQVVWGDTYQVGCGLEVCDTLQDFGSGTAPGTLIVCNYNPPGNYQGTKPFRLGEACTACVNGIYNCYEGMCRSDCSDVACECKACEVCQNCATVTPDCSCQCSTGWAGNTCSDQCVNAQTGCSGYDKNDCNEGSQYYSQMVADCYAYCGFCEAGDAATDCSLSGQEFCTGFQAPTNDTETPDNSDTSLLQGSVACTPVLAVSTLVLPVLLSAYTTLSH